MYKDRAAEAVSAHEFHLYSHQVHKVKLSPEDEALAPILPKAPKTVPLTFDDRGYPIPIKATELDGHGPKKSFLRDFMTWHWSKSIYQIHQHVLTHPTANSTPQRMAAVPWKKVLADNTTYIDYNYLPEGVTIQDPSRMNTGPVIECLDMIYNNYLVDPTNCFRWAQVWNGKAMAAPFYVVAAPLRSDDSDSDESSVKSTPAKRKKRKSKGKGAAKAKRPNNAKGAAEQPIASATAQVVAAPTIMGVADQEPMDYDLDDVAPSSDTDEDFTEELDLVGGSDDEDDGLHNDAGALVNSNLRLKAIGAAPCWGATDSTRRSLFLQGLTREPEYQRVLGISDMSPVRSFSL